MLLGRHDPRLQARRVSCLPTITQVITPSPPSSSTLPKAHYLAPPPPKEPVQFRTAPPVPAPGLAKPAPIRPQAAAGETEVFHTLTEVVNKLEEEKNTSIDSNETLKDTSNNKGEHEDDGEPVVDRIEIDEKPLENAEWCEFLDSQLEEMLEEVEGEAGGCLDSVDNQNFLTMLVSPLNNRHTDSLVLHKLCLLLSLPLATQDPDSPSVTSLLQAFRTKRLVLHLVTALSLHAGREGEDTTGLSSLTCLLLRLATSCTSLAAQLCSSLQPPPHQAALLSLLSSTKPTLQGDGAALVSQLLVLQGLSPSSLALLPSLLEPLVSSRAPGVAARAMTALGILARKRPDLCREVGARLGGWRAEAGMGEHARGALAFMRQGLDKVNVI